MRGQLSLFACAPGACPHEVGRYKDKSKCTRSGCIVYTNCIEAGRCVWEQREESD